MERYNFKEIEDKWQKFWEKEKTFSAKVDKNKKKILLSRNVSLSIWKNPYGTCQKLYDRRCASKI